VLTSCGGDTADGDAAGEDQGFEFGAEQADVDAEIEGLEPVTVTYQIPATSEQSPQANLGTHYKEAVEERSNGQITVELA
jgi:TRAP-type C4-dicarboxylate transport system substrate-binding protein